MNTNTKNKIRTDQKAWLYSLVFASKISTLAVLFLCVSFFIQPFHAAMASESNGDEEDTSTTTAGSVQLSEDESDDEAVAKPDTADLVASDETSDSSNSKSTDSEQEILDEEETDSLDRDVVQHASSSEQKTQAVQVQADTASDTNSTATAPVTATASSSPTTSTSFVDTPGVSTSTPLPQNTPAASTSTGTSQSVTATTTNANESTSSSGAPDVSTTTGVDATSTHSAGNSSSSQVTPTVRSDVAENPQLQSQSEPESDDTIETGEKVQAENITTEANHYQFSRQSCVAMGDGTYHCTKDVSSVVTTDAVVYAELHDDGYSQIYLRSARGDVRQLTDNQYDDTAPDFDAASMQVVWQRMIDSRYQVILYDIESGEETQLTFSRTNNMEPKVSKNGIVWQAWDNNDWEVMYFDGQYTDQITDNTLQDVAPVIEDGYILWNVLGTGEQEARVYSLDSGEVLTISGYEGGLIANPRFVLVYDTQFENGDIITQGFDPATGLSAPIAAKPGQEPIDIPDTDTTGEVRALLQSKTSHEEHEIEQDSGQNSNATSSQAFATSAATSTLDLSGATTTESVTAAPVAATSTDFVELDDYDLVITPEGVSTTSEDRFDDKHTASSTQS